MSNGCGCSSGLLKYIRPPYARYFYVACCMHDDDYDRGGDAKARRVADRALFRRCFRLIHDRETSPGRMVWLSLNALLYYASVRIFGRHFFNFNK